MTLHSAPQPSLSILPPPSLPFLLVNQRERVVFFFGLGAKHLTPIPAAGRTLIPLGIFHQYILLINSTQPHLFPPPRQNDSATQHQECSLRCGENAASSLHSQTLSVVSIGPGRTLCRLCLGREHDICRNGAVHCRRRHLQTRL